MDDEVKLHGAWSSPFSTRVLWTLKLKGIPYEYVEENLISKSPQLLEYNPAYKKVPVLVHGGKPLSESMFIVEYIDETWPQNPLLPADSYERAQTRFWVKYFEDKLPAFRALFLIGEEEDREKGEKEIVEMLQVIEEKCFLFGGENINVVDIAFGSLLHWVGVLEEVLQVKWIQPKTFPRLHSWLTKFTNLPLIAETLPLRHNLIALFKRREEKLSASS